MVDEETFKQFVRVQESGHCNMLDRNCVSAVAIEMGFDKLRDSIKDGGYSDIIANYSKYEEKYGT